MIIGDICYFCTKFGCGVSPSLRCWLYEEIYLDKMSAVRQ